MFVNFECFQNSQCEKVDQQLLTLMCFFVALGHWLIVQISNIMIMINHNYLDLFDFLVSMDLPDMWTSRLR